MKLRILLVGALMATAAAISPASADPTMCVYTNRNNPPDLCVPEYEGPVVCVELHDYSETLPPAGVCVIKLP